MEPEKKITFNKSAPMVGQKPIVSFDKGDIVEVNGLEFRIVYTRAGKGRITLEALPISIEKLNSLREKE